MYHETFTKYLKITLFMTLSVIMYKNQNLN